MIGVWARIYGALTIQPFGASAGADIAEAIFNAPVSPTAGQGVMVGQMLEPQVTIKTARRVPAPADAPTGCIVTVP